MEEEEIQIDVDQATRLEARRLVLPDARGGLVICHPHPLYGGDMDNPVVVRGRRGRPGERRLDAPVQLPRRGAVDRRPRTRARASFATSSAALDAPAGPPARAARPLGLAGYSFGAWVAARLASEVGTAIWPRSASSRRRLRMYDLAALDTRRLDVLVAAGTRDEYCPPDKLAALDRAAPRRRDRHDRGRRSLLLRQAVSAGRVDPALDVPLDGRLIRSARAEVARAWPCRPTG